MSSDTVIEVENLSKTYRIYERPEHRLWQMLFGRYKCFYKEYLALETISFDVQRGDVVGILGRNGSGKSTLLQMVCGTLSPSSGAVNVNGRVAALLELGSGFNPEFTGRENIYMNAQILGLSKDEIDSKFQSIVEFSEIGDFVERPVKTYSSGMYLRLAFSVIAHVDADVLIIDEALSVGDIFFTQKCMRFLHDFMGKGSILFVSHDLSSVKALCNKAIWLDDGVHVKSGDPKDICEEYLQKYFESQQGVALEKKDNSQNQINKTTELYYDQRRELLIHSNLRNDLKVFEFDKSATSFGKGGAKIERVCLYNKQGKALSLVVGGEIVSLKIEVNVYQELSSPIVGFYVKDKLGQELFGDNTYLVYEKNPLVCKRGDSLIAEFTFIIPMLPQGDYTVCVAIADGSMTEHIQHHWIHDALHFVAESSSVATGLVGIPMHNISLSLS